MPIDPSGSAGMRWAIHANRRRTHSRYRNTGFGHTHNGHTLISSRLSQLGIPLAHAQPGELSPLARWLRCGDAPGSLAPAMGNATAPTDACPSSLLLSARLPAPAALLPPLLPPRAPPTMLPPPCSPVVTPGALISWNRRPARRYFARDRLVLGRSLVGRWSLVVGPWSVLGRSLVGPWSLAKAFRAIMFKRSEHGVPPARAAERSPSSPALRGPSLPFLRSPAPSSSLQECEQRPHRCRGHSRPRLFAVQ